MLTAERLLSGKLLASPLAYKQSMFLSGAGSPWSLMTLLLLLSPSFLPLLVCVFFFVMLSFHSPPTHCCSLKLSQGWTPHCFCPCFLDVDVKQLHTRFDLFEEKKKRGSCLGQSHCIQLYIWLWIHLNSVSFIIRDCSQFISMLYFLSLLCKMKT